MRVRYCKLLQKVRMDKEEDAWLAPLEDVSSLLTDRQPLRRTRWEQVKQFLQSLRAACQPGMQPSPEWLVWESERPVKFTSKMKGAFRKLHLAKNSTDADVVVLHQWLDLLVQWMMDNEESVSVGTVKELDCRQKR